MARRTAAAVLLVTLVTGCAAPPRPAPAPVVPSVPGSPYTELSAWWQNESGGEEFCFTWVRTLAPKDFLARLRGQALAQQLTWPEIRTRHQTDPGPETQPRVALTALTGWTLMIEFGSDTGDDDTFATPLSQGTTLVTAIQPIDSASEFSVLRSGDLRTRFDPTYAVYRHGSAPDDYLPAMRRAGMQIDARAPESRPDALALSAALADQITGLTTSPQTLSATTYTWASIPRADVGRQSEDEGPHP